jgi:hypothetical protein
MDFYLIRPLVTLIPLGSIFFWAFKPYCDDGLLDILPTARTDGVPHPGWWLGPTNEPANEEEGL